MKQPCKKTLELDCCKVMDCINIESSDNSITVVKDECGVDITQTGNNLNQILKINNGECIQMVKEFLNGVLTYTPVINWACVADKICPICQPAPCPAPIGLSVILTPVPPEDEDLLMINGSDSFEINDNDNLEV